VFYFGSKRFVTAFTKDLDLYLSLAWLIQPIPWKYLHSFWPNIN
jgi:hypothetical protein